MTIDPYHVKASTLRETMVAMATDRKGKAVDPMEVAVAVVGKDEKVWRKLMKPIKEEAARLAGDGVLVILRKGKPTDPTKIRGLWRFRLKAEGEVLPDFAALAASEAELDDFNEEDEDI